MKKSLKTGEFEYNFLNSKKTLVMGPLQVCGQSVASHLPLNMIDLRPEISAADQIATFTSLSLPHHEELTNVFLCEHKQNGAGMCSGINPSRNKGIKNTTVNQWD